MSGTQLSWGESQGQKSLSKQTRSQNEMNEPAVTYSDSKSKRLKLQKGLSPSFLSLCGTGDIEARGRVRRES